MTLEQTKTFVLAGKATFTVSNGRPAPDTADYTFKVTRKERTDDRTRTGDAQPLYRDDFYFVSFLTGSDNENDFTYLGTLNPATGVVRPTKASKLNEQSKPFEVVNWALNRVWTGKPFPGNSSLQHAGHCGKCGRTLTVPESLESGLGPECSGLGYTKPRNERKPRAKKAAKPTFAEQRAAAQVTDPASFSMGAPSPYAGRTVAEATGRTEQPFEPLRVWKATDHSLPVTPASWRLPETTLEAERELALGVGGEIDREYDLDANGEDSVDRAERALGVQ